MPALLGHPAHHQGEHQHEEHEGHDIVHQERQQGADGGLVIHVILDAGGLFVLIQIGDYRVVGFQLDGEEVQPGGLLVAGLIREGVNGIAVGIGGLGIDGAVFGSVGAAVLQGDVEDVLRVVELHHLHLVLGHHVLEDAVLHGHGGSLVSGGAEVGAGVADDDGGKQSPADQRDHTPPVSIVFILVVVFAVFVVLVHVWTPFGLKA